MICGLFWILILILTFLFMEFVAWFSHKYIMHGFLWSWHKDHHKKDHDSWFEKMICFFSLRNPKYSFCNIVGRVFVLGWFTNSNWNFLLWLNLFYCS